MTCAGAASGSSSQKVTNAHSQRTEPRANSPFGSNHARGFSVLFVPESRITRQKRYRLPVISLFSRASAAVQLAENLLSQADIIWNDFNQFIVIDKLQSFFQSEYPCR